VIERLKGEYDVAVEWKPFFLHPEMPPDGMILSPTFRTRMAGAHEQLKQMAHAAGMEVVFADYVPNSRRALEATEYARAQGKDLEFHRIVFRKFYGEGQDISKWEALRAAAQEAGLDADAMQRETESGKFTAGFDAQIEEAYSLGITGVPTYILNDKYAIVGAQPYEVFKRAIARLEDESTL
jgi:predicted DsbA family dithiol-disulfide isomerase